MSAIYRISYLVKTFVARMAADEEKWGHFKARVYKRTPTTINIAVLDPGERFETHYVVSVNRLYRRKVAGDATDRAGSLPAS